MFPINANDPYIKENGERSTMGSVIGSGGGGASSELPEHSISDAGKALTVGETGDLEWTRSLPTYSQSDAGKVLGIDENGALVWSTVKGGSFGKARVSVPVDVDTSGKEVV